MEYSERLAQARALYTTTVSKEKPEQKFKTGTIVRIADDLGGAMSHFMGKGGEAVVEYTYDQKYGGGNIKSYSLILLDEKGHPYNSCSWYGEEQLTLVEEDTKAGLLLIKVFEGK